MEYNPFANAQAQFDKVADIIGLEQGTRELLRRPMNEFHFTIPVKMDDGGTRVFQAYRMRHNDALGPAKGGIRFHPHETADTVRALSMWMTWKCAVADIPLGGGKGGIVCDPRNMSLGEQERLCRGYVRGLYPNIGPVIDVPAPDIMSNRQHMLWMMDEYETLTGGRYPGVITGKPVGMGGSLGRAEATGYGMIYVLKDLLEAENINIKSTTACIQGFGLVAEYAAKLYSRLGGKVIAVACKNSVEDEPFIVKKKDGCNIEELSGIKQGWGINKGKAHALGYEVLPGGEGSGGDAWLSEEVDILMPAAVENQITPAVFPKINKSVKIILEGANGPTTPDCDPLIQERGIIMLPDFLANAGGVTCSYFEQVQCNMNYFWGLDEVLEKVNAVMSKAFKEVYRVSKEKEFYMRDAAYYIAINKVSEAVKLRGWV